MKNTKRLLAVILALAIAVSSIAVTALTTSAADEADTNMYEFFYGDECYVDAEGWDDEAYRNHDNWTYSLDYYEKDLYAPFDPANTTLEVGKTYKAVYWLTINNINNFYVDTAGWEAKFMPTEEYYFNITNADIWDGVGPTSTAVVVPFTVTDINNVKLKMWTHGALIEGSCVEAIYVVGADYNVYAEGIFDIVVEGVANAGSNVEANRPADDEWTPSDPDAVVEPEPVEPVEGMNATILKPVLATQNYVDIIGEDSYGAQASLGENVTKFDASIETLIEESFVQNMVETTEVVAGNQDNYVKMWTGTMTAAESGEYTLIGRKIDNGFVMYVDGQKVYEYWGASHWFDGAEDRVVSDLGSFEVVAGESYDVEIYFLEIGGGDALEIFATTTPADTNSGANINEVFDFDLVETTLWLADGGHWADFTNDTLVGAPTGDGGDGQCSEETALFDESFANLVLNFSNWEEKVVSSFAEPIEAYDGDTAYMIVYEGTLVPNVSGEYTFGANAVDNGFYLEIGDDVAYEFWVGRRWNDTTGNTYTDSVTLEAGVEYPFFAAFLETNGGQALDLVASVDGGDRISVDELFTFSTKIIEEEDPDDPVEPTDENVASIEVVSDEPLTVIENYNGYWEQWYNEEIGEYQDFFYYNMDFLYDLTVRINYADGTCVTTTVYDSVDGDWVSWYQDQAVNPWTMGSDNYFTLTYRGVSTQVPVTVIENPVESIEVVSGEIAPIVENTNGLWDSRYNEETGEYEEYFCYWVDPSEDFRLQINYTDGTSTIASMEDEYDFSWLDDQYANPWVVGETYYVTIEYLGATAQLPVTIISLEEALGEIPAIQLSEVTQAVISEAGQPATFRFTPEEDGYYAFYSMADEDTHGYILDTGMNELNWADSGGNEMNFRVAYQMEAGTTYILQAFNWDDTFVGTFDVCVERLKDVESIEIASGEIAPIVENTNGYWAERYNEETGEYEKIFYYQVNFSEDFAVNINYTDGTYQTAGVDEKLDGVWVSFYDNQFENPWVAGGNYYVTIEYCGVTTQLPVTVIENPVESIEVVSDEILTVVENTNGYWEEWYNEETGEYEEFFYYWINYSEDFKVRINYTDGTSITTDVYEQVDGDRISFFDEQFENPWVAGETYYVTVEYRGVATQVPVTVIENPVESIAFASGTIPTYYENCDGYWGEWYNEETDSWENVYYYDVIISEDIMMRINYKDGTSAVVNILDYVNGHEFDWSSDQYEKPWTVGGDNYITVSYLGATAQLPVSVVESPVESLELITLPNLTELEYGFVPDFIGMQFRIQYKDGTSEVVTVDDSNFQYNGWDFEIAWGKNIAEVSLYINEETDTYINYGFDISYMGQMCSGEVTASAIDNIQNVTISNVSDDGYGMQVYLEYLDGTTETITIDELFYSEREEWDDGYVYWCIAQTDKGLLAYQIETAVENDKQIMHEVYIFNWIITAFPVQLENAGVIIGATTETVDPDTELYVEEQEQGNVVITDNGEYNLDTAVFYDIYMMKGDEVVQPDGMITVSIPIPAHLNGELCKVIYVDDFGNVTEMDAQFIDGYMVFQTNHFSYYGIVEESESTDTLIGDVNSDGVVNAKDVASLRRYLAGGWDVTIDEAAADVNADGTINAKDVASLRRYLAGGWDVELG